MTALDRSLREQRALRYSVYVVMVYVLMSIGFAILTRSDAILFDGIYSAISLGMAFLTLWVARLAVRPDDDRFHFGYGALEPFLNLCKSLIVIVICLFAATAAVHRLMLGGTEANYGLAIYYGLVATVLCFGMEFYLRHANRDIRSDLVRVEARSWFMDGLLSAAVLLGFAAATWLQRSEWPQYAPLADPVIVLLLVVVALPVPGRVLLDSMREVITMAPAAGYVAEIEKRLHASLDALDTQYIEYRVSKRGRQTYLLVHVIVAEGLATLSIAELDVIRRDSMSALQAWNPDVRVHMLFTRDRALAD